jgi:hypothetical protein
MTLAIIHNPITRILSRGHYSSSIMKKIYSSHHAHFQEEGARVGGGGGRGGPRPLHMLPQPRSPDHWRQDNIQRWRYCNKNLEVT